MLGALPDSAAMVIQRAEVCGLYMDGCQMEQHVTKATRGDEMPIMVVRSKSHGNPVCRNVFLDPQNI